MKDLTFTKHERISLRDHPDLDETWIQARIAEDPSLLGLGDLILKDRERPQPKAGRLDLLLQDPETLERYEVEIQLGETDETHIVRTIEYWDIEKKRYPQYDHTAVLIAESITSRFFNVINLFNGFIPLVAIQMSAIRMGDHLSLVFTKVLDKLTLGLVDEDEELREVVDRAYWEERGTRETVAMADDLLRIIHSFDDAFDLKYNKFYIGLARNDRPFNFAAFKPQKNGLRVEVRYPKSEEMEQRLEEEGLDTMGYDQRYGLYKFRLVKGDIDKHSAFLADFLSNAYKTMMR